MNSRQNKIWKKSFSIPALTVVLIKCNLVAGAHTLGVGHCRNFENRLRPRADPAISPSHAFVLKTIYSGLSVSDIAFATNDATATSFDNRYFIDTLNGRGLLKIDSDISRDPRTLSHVVRFGISLEQLFERFSYGFSKLSNYKALVGDVGKIRRDSRFSNWDPEIRDRFILIMGFILIGPID